MVKGNDMEYINNVCGTVAPSNILLPLPYIGDGFDSNISKLIPEFENLLNQYTMQIKQMGASDNWFLRLNYQVLNQQKYAYLFCVRVLDKNQSFEYLQLNYTRLLDYCNSLFTNDSLIHFPIPFWEQICHIEYLEMFLIEYNVNAKLIQSK